MESNFFMQNSAIVNRQRFHTFLLWFLGKDLITIARKMRARWSWEVLPVRRKTFADNVLRGNKTRSFIEVQTSTTHVQVPIFNLSPVLKDLWPGDVRYLDLCTCTFVSAAHRFLLHGALMPSLSFYTNYYRYVVPINFYHYQLTTSRTLSYLWYTVDAK